MSSDHDDEQQQQHDNSSGEVIIGADQQHRHHHHHHMMEQDEEEDIEDNCDFTLRLISEVQAHPCLYDRSDDQYRNTFQNQAYKGQLWESLAALLRHNSNGTDLQMQWKRVRDHYVRDRKKIVQSGYRLQSSWRYYSHMQWIDPFLIDCSPRPFNLANSAIIVRPSPSSSSDYAHNGEAASDSSSDTINVCDDDARLHDRKLTPSSSHRLAHSRNSVGMQQQHRSATKRIATSGRGSRSGRGGRRFARQQQQQHDAYIKERQQLPAARSVRIIRGTIGQQQQRGGESLQLRPILTTTTPPPPELHPIGGESETAAASATIIGNRRQSRRVVVLKRQHSDQHHHQQQQHDDLLDELILDDVIPPGREEIVVGAPMMTHRDDTTYVVESGNVRATAAVGTTHDWTSPSQQSSSYEQTPITIIKSEFEVDSEDMEFIENLVVRLSAMNEDEKLLAKLHIQQIIVDSRFSMVDEESGLIDTEVPIETITVETTDDGCAVTSSSSSTQLDTTVDVHRIDDNLTRSTSQHHESSSKQLTETQMIATSVDVQSNATADSHQTREPQIVID